MDTGRQQQCVILAFGVSRVEVPCETWNTEGGLAALARVAKLAFDLAPQSFDLYDASGRLESDSAVKRAAAATGVGCCVIEARERLEWKRMREMDAKINALMDMRLNPHVDTAISTFEKRLTQIEGAMVQVKTCLASVESKMNAWHSMAPLVECFAADLIDARAQIENLEANLGQVETKVNQSVAPLLECLASDQIDTKSEIKGLREILELADAKVNHVVAPLLKNLTMEQIEMKSDFDGLKESLEKADVQMNRTVAPLLQSLAAEQIDHRGSIDLLREVPKQATGAEVDFLRKEFQTLKAQIEQHSSFSRKPSAETEQGQYVKFTAADLDLNSHASWQLNPSLELHPEIVYSKKIGPTARGHRTPAWSAATAAPFARGCSASRQLDRTMASSRSWSSPNILPPLAP